MSKWQEAVVDAVQKWQYEPLRVNGRAKPVCMTVTVNVRQMASCRPCRLGPDRVGPA